MFVSIFTLNAAFINLGVALPIGSSGAVLNQVNMVTQ